MAKTEGKAQVVGTLLNPGTNAVVYNNDGQIIEPGKQIEITVVDETTKRAIDAGLLTLDRSTTESGDAEPEPEAPADGATAKKPAPPKAKKPR